MAWRGSISRSITTTARSVRTSPSSSSAFRQPSPPVSSSRLPRRAPSFSSSSRPLGVLGCLQSLIPMQGEAIPRLTSHVSAAVRACCELSQEMGKMVDATCRWQFDWIPFSLNDVLEVALGYWDPLLKDSNHALFGVPLFSQWFLVSANSDSSIKHLVKEYSFLIHKLVNNVTIDRLKAFLFSTCMLMFFLKLKQKLNLFVSPIR